MTGMRNRAGLLPAFVCGIGVMVMSDSLAAPAEGRDARTWRTMSPAPGTNGIAIACGDLPEPACTALAEGLAGRDSDTAWTVTMEMTRISGTAIEGRLVWQAAGQPPVRGPLRAVSVMDRDVGPDTYGQLARALLKITGLPF